MVIDKFKSKDRCQTNSIIVWNIINIFDVFYSGRLYHEAWIISLNGKKAESVIKF